jgi:hypothetical protein
MGEGEQDKLPEGTTLIPGMPVEAFIRTEGPHADCLSGKAFDRLFCQGVSRVGAWQMR